jgi:archaellum component FlaC
MKKEDVADLVNERVQQAERMARNQPNKKTAVDISETQPVLEQSNQEVLNTYIEKVKQQNEEIKYEDASEQVENKIDTLENLGIAEEVAEIVDSEKSTVSEEEKKIIEKIANNTYNADNSGATTLFLPTESDEQALANEILNIMITNGYDKASKTKKNLGKTAMGKGTARVLNNDSYVVTRIKKLLDNRFGGMRSADAMSAPSFFYALAMLFDSNFSELSNAGWSAFNLPELWGYLVTSFEEVIRKDMNLREDFRHQLFEPLYNSMSSRSGALQQLFKSASERLLKIYEDIAHQIRQIMEFGGPDAIAKFAILEKQLRETMSKLENEIKKARQEYNDIDADLNTKQKKVNELKTEIEKNKKELSKKTNTSEINTLKSAIDKLETTVEQLKKEIAEKKDEQQEISKNINELENEYKSGSDIIELLNQNDYATALAVLLSNGDPKKNARLKKVFADSDFKTLFIEMKKQYNKDVKEKSSKLLNIATAMDSFRYVAMLSSPST